MFLDMNVPKEGKGDSPASHQTSSQQSEAKQQSQPVAQKPSLAADRTFTMVGRTAHNLVLFV